MQFFADAQAPSGAGEDIFRGSLLLLPAVSVGAVGQLAVDLLLQSLPLHRVGFLEHPAVLPCVGNDALDWLPQESARAGAGEGEAVSAPLPVAAPAAKASLRETRPWASAAEGRLSVPMEVFQDPQRLLTVVQQRSPVVQGRMPDFARDLAHWSQSVGVEGVLVLSGADAGKRTQDQMQGSQFRYYTAGSAAQGQATVSAALPAAVPGHLSSSSSASPAQHQASSWLSSSRLLPLESVQPFTGSSLYPAVRPWGEATGDMQEEEQARREGAGEELLEDASLEEGAGQAGPGPLEGGHWGPEGLPQDWSAAFVRLTHAFAVQGISSSAILLFCSEGDNVRDALCLAATAAECLGLWLKSSATVCQEKSSLREVLASTLELIIPKSWAHLFGPPADPSLFG